jgi:hypothetical protein
MRVVAHPTGKIFAVLGRVDALVKFLIDPLEMVLGIILVPTVAVKACELLLHAELARVRKVLVIIGMAVKASKVPVITLVIERRVNDEIWVHPLLDGPLGVFIEIIVCPMAMAF